MKNYFLTLLASIALFSANAQLSITLTSPVAGSTVVANGFNPAVTITNTGTSAIPIGDTIFYWVTTGTSTTPYSFGGSAGSWSIDILTAALAPGASLTKTCVTYSFTSPTSTPTTINVCAKTALGLTAARDDASAASSCYTLDRSLASTNELSLENTTKIFANASQLNLSSTSAETLNYMVYTTSGKLITSGTFTSSKQVDMNFAKGIYAVVVYNENERFTKKIAIQ